ncbi:hypothetical protein MsAg5_05410 [Methanosarcinaceae archaeon Ag5]|uniref:Antitoxin SocA-like Panacea domain-containing protein n=1 Tax=Methanolapillus africanus TaxID=3028297 RepID=A0AAE4MIW3_9EURY|nr:hypothetical protein [Methanosarcinaceae archaeon Ag5]
MTNHNPIPNYDIKDVANWFLNKEPMTQKKLQKLCYYAVAWSYTLRKCPLCTDCEFEAWIHGPVNRVLYREYRSFGWTPIPQVSIKPDFGDAEDLLETVWNTYGDLSGIQLEIMSHKEKPWLNARKGYGTYDRSVKAISSEDMIDFYWKMYEEGQND